MNIFNLRTFNDASQRKYFDFSHERYSHASRRSGDSGAQKNININFNCGETRSSPLKEYLRISAAARNEPAHPFRGYGKSCGYTGLLTPPPSIGGSIAILHRARYRAIQIDAAGFTSRRLYTRRVKSERFHARGHLTLNPRATAKTILAWRENIFSHCAIKT